MVYKFLCLMAILGITSCNSTEFLSFDKDSKKNPVPDAPPPRNDDLSAPMDFSTTAEVFSNQKMVLSKDGNAETEIKLQNGTLFQEKSFFQKSPEVKTSLFNQAKSLSQKETFAQENIGIVDIALVIDNSGSMSQEQINLGNKLAPLIESIADADWRIGIITTDPSDTCIRSLVTKQDQNPSNIFRSAILGAGTNGSGREQGFRQAVTALDCKSPAPWVRNNSTIGVLIVSDEDNCSSQSEVDAVSNHPCRNQPFRFAEHLTSFISNNLDRDLGVESSIYGIFKIPGDNSCNTAPFFGEEYQRSVNLSGGTSGSICDADYSNTLNSISRDLATKLKNEFPLNLGPNDRIVDNTLVVKVNGTEISSGFIVNRSSIEFTDIPDLNSTIEVEYDLFSNDEVQRRFNINEVPALGTVKVFINGNEAPSGSFTQNNSVIRFNDSPPLNSVIKIDYEIHPDLLDSFVINSDAEVIKVTVNGIENSDFTYNSLDGSVKFVSILPPLSSEIKINYTNDGEPQLVYDIDFFGTNIKNVIARDRLTGAETPITYSSGKIEFPESSFIPGRRILISYDSSSVSGGILDLKTPLIVESVLITSENTTCKVGQGIEVKDGKSLEFDCLIDEESIFIVNYQFKSIVNQFVLSDFTESEIEQYGILVKVDEVETNNFTLDNGTLTINDTLQLDSEVIVSLNTSF